MTSPSAASPLRHGGAAQHAAPADSGSACDPPLPARMISGRRTSPCGRRRFRSLGLSNSVSSPFKLNSRCPPAPVICYPSMKVMSSTAIWLSHPPTGVAGTHPRRRNSSGATDAKAHFHAHSAMARRRQHLETSAAGHSIHSVDTSSQGRLLPFTTATSGRGRRPNNGRTRGSG